MSEELRHWPLKVHHVAVAMCAKMGQSWDGPGMLRPDDYLLMAEAAVDAINEIHTIRKSRSAKPWGEEVSEMLRLIPRRLVALINADVPTPPKAVGAAMQKDGTHG